MLVIHADNVNDALAQAVEMMRTEPDSFLELAPRAGKLTREWYCPVATVYARPWRCVLFNQVRDANPFFHLMEAIWMLDGRRDAEWLSQFSSRISQYAEYDGNFHGAYGWRWRRHFVGYAGYCGEIDQLERLITLLRREPSTRRAVLAMWDPAADLGSDSKRDLPCNTHVYFKIRDSRLHMTVCCRSNDLILGAYGANAVHFSILHSFVAAAVGVAIGRYTHVSDSWHYYVDNPYARRVLEYADQHSFVDDGYDDYYRPGMAGSRVGSMEVVNSSAEDWLKDARIFTTTQDWNDSTQYVDTFFHSVAVPMRDAWALYKRDALEDAITRSRMVKAPDWRRAAEEWLVRRLVARKQEVASVQG